MFADAHLHIAKAGFGTGYRDISDAGLLFCNATGPSDRDILERLMLSDDRVIAFFGTHPWFSDEYDGDDALIDILERHPEAHVGEIGLDRIRSGHDPQRVFEEQLRIASEMDRVANIHMVRSTDDVLAALRRCDVRSIIHSYDAPAGLVNAFIERGCYLSISPRLFKRSEGKVSDILRAIPKDRLLLESDHEGGDMDMHGHISKVASVIGMDTDELSEMTYRNACDVLKG